MASKEHLVALGSTFESLAKAPELFFRANDGLLNGTILNVKALYDFSMQSERMSGHKRLPSLALKELLVENFDDEQIWQQIELHNKPVISTSKLGLREVHNLESLCAVDPLDGNSDHAVLLSTSSPPRQVEYEDDFEPNDDNRFSKMRPVSSSEDEDDTNYRDSDTDKHARKMSCDENDKDCSDESDSDGGIRDGVGSDQQECLGEGEMACTELHTKYKPSMGRKSYKGGSVVDDRFFKLSEMNDFLDKMDQEFENRRTGKGRHNDGDDDIDYFMDIDSNSDDSADNSDDVDDWDNATQAVLSAIGRTSKITKGEKSKRVTDLKYQDFFDPPNDADTTTSNQMHSDDQQDNEGDDASDMDANESDSNSEEEEVAEEEDQGVFKNYEQEKRLLSQHEKNQNKLKQKIEELEKENLSKKSWQMTGEAGSKMRPVNSLLEEDLGFDHTTTSAPPITEETTQSLEDTIKQRIKDEAWDDVERKTKPTVQPYEYKKKQPLDQEKSKLSLSQIYEQEYLKQTAEPENQKEEEGNPEHTEIKVMMAKLFTKLDALSNFHFTPKPLKPELKIVTNTPAINMEEVAPVSNSDAMLLAPEETHAKMTELKGDSERTDTDKKRARRTKKLKQRQKVKEKERKRKLVEKLNPGLGNKYAKKDAMSKLEKDSKTSRNVSLMKEEADRTTLKSSTQFFSQLQDEVKQQVQSKKVIKKGKSKSVSSSQLKL